MSTAYAIDPSPENLELALELAELTRPQWARISDGIPAGTPRLEGEDAGAAGEGDEGDAGKTGDGDDDDTGSGKAGDGDDDDDDDAPDEVKAARKAAAAANRELRELKRAGAERERKAAESAGKWEDLYKQEKARADALEEAAESGARERLAIAALAELKCRNPSRYLRLMDLEDVEDEADALRAARKLRKSDPDLFRDPSTRQKRSAGGRDDDDDKADDDDDDDRQRTQQRRPVSRLRRGLEKSTPK